MARNRTRTAGKKAPIRGYDNWTVGELRQKLSRRKPEELRELLSYEKGGRNRKSAIEIIERAFKERGGKKKSSSGSRGGGSGLGEVVERVKSGVQTGMKRVRELVGMPAESLGELSRERFMDRLSEFLEHERGGAKIYELGLQKEEITDEQRERLQEYADQTSNHIEILTTVIAALGGDPDRLSESAELDRKKAEALLDTDVPGEVGLLNYFQNLWIAELVDHMNWEFLEKVKAKTSDEEIRQVLEQHVESVEDEEDEHYRWAQKQVEELSMMHAFSEESGEADSGEAESGEDEEDEGDEEAA